MSYLEQCIAIIREKGRFIIYNTVEVLNTKDSSTYSKALKKLNALVKVFVNGNIPNLYHVIPVVLDPLSTLLKQDHIEESVQIMILEIFINLTTVDLKYIQKILEYEILQPVKKFLSSDSIIIRQLSAWLLSNIAVNENNLLKIYLVDEGILDVVIKLILDEKSIFVLKHQASLLLNIIAESQRSKVDIHTFQTLFVFMMKFIENEDGDKHDIKICFLNCLFVFSQIADSEHLKLLVDSKIHLLFSYIMKNKTDVSLKIFLSIIQNLIYSTDVFFTNTLLNSGLLQNFIDILSDGNYDENIRIEVIYAISNIVCDSVANIRILFIDTPLIPILIHKLEHDTLNCKKQILWVFRKITDHYIYDIDVLKILYNLNLIELLEQLLLSLSFEKNYGFCCLGIQVIINFFNHFIEAKYRLSDSFKQKINHYAKYGLVKLQKKASILLHLIE